MPPLVANRRGWSRRRRIVTNDSNHVLRFCLLFGSVIATHMILQTSSVWRNRPDIDALLLPFTESTHNSTSSTTPAEEPIRRRRKFELFRLGGSNDPIATNNKANIKDQDEIRLQLLMYSTASCEGPATDTTNIRAGEEPMLFAPFSLPKSVRVQGEGLVEVFAKNQQKYLGAIVASEGCVDFYKLFNPQDELEFVLYPKERKITKPQISSILQQQFSTVSDLTQPHTRIVYSATSADYFGYQLLANAYSFLQSNQTNASWMRLLTARVPDDLSERFPTFTAPKSLFSHTYVPINKADVIDKWFQSDDAPHPNDTIVVIDPDNWLLKSIEPWTRDVSEKQALGQLAYYGWHPDVTELWQEFCLEQEHCERKLDPVGVPYIVKASDLKDIAPLWRSYSIAIKQRFQENATFAEYYGRLGIEWASEMYAYNFANAHLGISTKVLDNLQLRDTSTSRDWKRWSKIPMIHMGRAWFPPNETKAAEPWRHADDGGFNAMGIQTWCKCNMTAAQVQPWPMPDNMDVVSYHTLRILHDSKEMFGPVPVNKTFRRVDSPYWAAP